MDCTACGYSGDMARERRGLCCPACGVVSRFESRVTRTLECPGCGRTVGVTAEDEGRTVLCPACSCFLGTPLQGR
jgi:transcription initiation factor IIE alpha subunit